MRSSFLEQASKLLKDHYKRSRWLSVVMCLALVVAGCTFYTFMRQGRAMVRTEKVLQCPLLTHVHTENCGGGLYCGAAEYVFHSHGDYCFDAVGNLACMLPEIPAHIHDEACWQTEWIQACGLEEGPGHVHAPECYAAAVQPEPEVAPEPMVLNETVGELLCVLPEHTHTEICYSVAEGEPVLACGQEEISGHQHSEVCYMPDMLSGPLCGQEENHFHSLEAGCYHMERTLVCGWEEGMEHIHSDSCYIETPVFICSREEGHVHLPDCFGQILSCGQEESAGHWHTEACYVQQSGEAVLTCGQEEHVHMDTCYAVPATPDAGEQPQLPAGPGSEETQPICGLTEQEEHVHTELCWEERSTLVCSLPGVHTHNESCYNEYGERICGQLQIEEHVHGPACLIEVPVEDGLAGVYLCGREEHQHTAFCGLPGMTWCGLEEHLHTEVCLSGGPDVPADPENPETPENPADPENPEEPGAVDEVAEPELPEGKSWMCGVVSHRHDPQICYNEAGVLVCERQEHTHTEECLPPKDPDPVSLDEEYSYTTEDGLFDIKFHIAGVALLPVGEEPVLDMNGIPAYPETGISGVDAPAPYDPVGLSAEAEIAGGQPGTDPDGFPEVPFEPEVPVEPELAFTVTALDGNNHDYFLFFQQAAEREEQLLSALTISVAYGGRELDLSGCTITAEIVPTEKLLSTMLESGGEDGEVAGLRLTAYEKDGAMGVEILDSVYIDGQSGVAAQPQTPGTQDVPAEPVQPGQTAYPETYYGAEPDWSMDDGTRSLTRMDYAAPPQYADPADAGAGLVESGGQTGISLADLRMTVTVKGSKEGADLAVGAIKTNYAKFTVQYYAKVKNADITASEGPELIDTRNGGNGSGGNLPRNGILTPATVHVTRSNDGSIKMSERLVEIYRSSQELSYENFKYLDEITALPKIDHYDRVAIWVLKEGRDAASDKVDDWDVRNVNAEFTNNPELKTDPNYVVIENGTILRLVYEPSEGTYCNSTTFYDYDISDGKIYTEQGQVIEPRPDTTKFDDPTIYYMKNEADGINSAGNFSGWGNKLAFGNGNAGVSQGIIGSATSAPNQARSDTYGKCFFGIVGDTLDDGMNLRYNFSAPNLFHEGTAAGKSKPIPAELRFNRVGDTYTLTAVNGAQASAVNLDKLSLKFLSWNKTQTYYSNLFWPLDASTETWGTEGHDMKFGAADKSSRLRSLSGPGPDLPATDEQNGSPKKMDVFHNSYFGMTFAVDFKVAENYVGPLEYLFFGDDDMWVYLVGPEYPNGKLVCDIGGVHPAAGEYVDLWDYIPKIESSQGTTASPEGIGETEKTDNTRYYTLYFFFTERGASGSTCWMQFTVPDASSRVLTPPDTPASHTMKLKKTVEGGEVDPNKEFEFEITFDGQKKDDLFYYTRYHADDTPYGDDENGYEGHPDKTLSNSNNKFKLKSGEYIRIQGMVNGTTYTIKELLSESEKDAYHLETSNPDITIDGSTASGSVGENSPGDIDVTLVNKVRPRLPETAGPGVVHYTILGGLLALSAGGGLLWSRKRRRDL